MILRNQKPNYIYSVDVKNWQSDLAALGYSLKIDGFFGDETEGATRQFQKDMNIGVDGIVGDITRDAMEKIKDSKAKSYKKGSTGSMVLWIQQQYVKRGYNLSVDGIFGVETESVTKLFQEEMNIQVDGIVGPITMGKLKESLGTPVKKIKIFIDNGHEPGNVNGGSQGYKEWEGNLKSARYLKNILMNTNQFEVLLTYDWNKFATVRQRGNKSASWGAQLMLSIHSNAGGGSGTECYYSIDKPSDKKYAESITEKISKEFEIPNRGAKVKESQTTKGEDYMGVIDSAQDSGVDHILLVESMFHDNDKEERYLLKNETHQKLARIYAETIKEMFLGKV